MKQLGQRLIKVHAIAGIFFGLLFYIIMYFGIFTIVENYIKTWEKPSRHFASLVKNEEIKIDKYLKDILLDSNIPKDNMKIRFPNSKEDNALIISPAFMNKIALNPNTGQKLEDESRQQSSLYFFLHKMHTGWQIYKSVGYTIFGLVAVASIFLMLTGLIQVLTIKYSNKGGTALKSSSKWHRKLSLWFFFPILIIFISGAALNLQVKGIKKLSTPLAYYVSDGKENKWKKILGSTIFPNDKIIKKDAQVIKMMSLEKLYKKARELNPNLEYAYMKLFRWNDTSAQVKFVGYNSNYPFFNGYTNLPSITLSAVDGSLVNIKKVFDFNWVSIFYEFVHFLHFVPFIGFAYKFILILIVIAFTAGTAFGIWLYLEKKAKKFEGKIPFYNFVSRLSMTVMIGVLPATAILFCSQWGFPINMSERLLWQEGIFFLTWLLMALISFARLDSNDAARTVLYIGAVLFLLAPIIHWIQSGFSALKLLELEMYVILGVDLSLIFLSLFCFVFAYILPKKREENEKLWKRI